MMQTRKVPATFRAPPEKKTFLIFLENVNFILQYFIRQKNYICMQNAEGEGEGRKSLTSIGMIESEKKEKEKKTHTKIVQI